jgi:superfamily II DNA/RNA helicase
VSTTAQSLVKTGRDPHDKRDTLRRLIRASVGMKNAIIFCNRKREVATLHRSLVRHGFSAIALHGDMDQSARTAALEQFRRNEVTLLVASDVAARGLDIPDVSHVFNFDVPHHADDYVHRIGRTGRAGRSGVAITIVAPTEQKSVTAIEKLIGQPIPWAAAPGGGADEPVFAEEETARTPRRRGDRQGRHSQERAAPKQHAEKRAPHKRPPQERHQQERPPQQQRPASERPAEQRPAPERHPQERHPQERHPQERVAKVASIENARPRRQAPPARPRDEEPDVAHLPAFLLRPVRSIKA